MNESNSLPTFRKFAAPIAATLVFGCILLSVSSATFVKGALSHQIALRILRPVLGIVPGPWHFSISAEFAFGFLNPGTVAGFVYGWMSQNDGTGMSGLVPGVLAGFVLVLAMPVFASVGYGLYFYVYVPILAASLLYGIPGHLFGRIACLQLGRVDRDRAEKGAV